MKRADICALLLCGLLIATVVAPGGTLRR
jgi:hypothetical protein